MAILYYFPNVSDVLAANIYQGSQASVFSDLALYFILIIIIATIVEEYLFRGVILQKSAVKIWVN